MATYSFTLPNGQPFEVVGPATLTAEQAKAIFDQQAKAGSLVGLKPGDVVSAATQAAAGLNAAQAAVAQAQSGVTGALGGGIPGAAGAIGQVTAALGAAGGALGGSLSGTAAGLTGAVGTAVSGVAKAVGTISPTATAAIGTINQTLAATPVTDPIGLANFARQTPALAPIGSMNIGQVTGVLAQAKNLTGQSAAVMTDAKGLGEYGLTVSQLETAGIVKPGMSSLVAAGATTTDVLKSPAAFTGVAGVKTVDDLLQNPMLQNSIQQDLMSKGVAGLSAAGIPTNLLNAEGLAGMSLNAAKSLPDAVNFAKGLPVPDAAALATNVRDGAFAAKLAETKVPPAWKAETVPEPKSDTVNRETVNAASARVVGNEKVPEPNYGPTEPTPGEIADIGARVNQGFTTAGSMLATANSRIAQLDSQTAALENRQSITDQQWTALDSEYTALRTYILEDIAKKVFYPTQDLYFAAGTEVINSYRALFISVRDEINTIAPKATAVRKRINALKAKIDTP